MDVIDENKEEAVDGAGPGGFGVVVAGGGGGPGTMGADDGPESAEDGAGDVCSS